jgi:hypothetical protein
MGVTYDIELIRDLRSRMDQLGLARPGRVDRYEKGDELTYDVQPLDRQGSVRARVIVEKFVGGGFAGQVYRSRLLDLSEPIAGLEIGKTCAVKILIPPSGFSRLFRDCLYRIGFQGPFQHQVNPAAARAGALWQKLVRRAAGMRFGDERSVADIYATLVDDRLGSCGELREWVEGRTWRLEVDDRLDLLKCWIRRRPVDPATLGSPEYRAKRVFMRDFVALLHEMGAFELARQYEWSTCKSQPNCLKRSEYDGDPEKGLVAVDFRAGLVLLPFLPMSPGDFKLIGQGIARGSLVQFDRGDLGLLKAFVARHQELFADMRPAIGELEQMEAVYRDSVPDITHNHVRLLYSGKLWSTLFDSAVTSWTVRGLTDQKSEPRLRASRIRIWVFAVLGLIPILGKVLRKAWARQDWRRHYAAILTSPGYALKALHARILHGVISWHRSGRISQERARRIADQPWRFFGHLPFSILPAGWHRLSTDWAFAKERLVNLVLRPVRLYFNAAVREQWLKDMVAEGKAKHMLTGEDADLILAQIHEPFIQKYLKSLAVHVLLMPTTHVVAIALAFLYIWMHPELPRAQAWATGLGIVALFQVVPISPGSLARGVYTTSLVIRERNVKDYNIALWLSFFKYVGYLAFPIQMTYRYPALARFMAGHWATEAVHIVPVFGEHGALLERSVFDLFYNWPLTVRGRIARRHGRLAGQRSRYWHAGLVAGAAAGVLLLVDLVYVHQTSQWPDLRNVWWILILLAGACGSLVTIWAGKGTIAKRTGIAAVCGVSAVALYGLLLWITGIIGQIPAGRAAAGLIWRFFVLTILSAIAAVVTEIVWPEAGLGETKTSSIPYN